MTVGRGSGPHGGGERGSWAGRAPPCPAGAELPGTVLVRPDSAGELDVPVAERDEARSNVPTPDGPPHPAVAGLARGVALVRAHHPVRRSLGGNPVDPAGTVGQPAGLVATVHDLDGRPRRSDAGGAPGGDGPCGLVS